MLKSSQVTQRKGYTLTDAVSDACAEQAKEETAAGAQSKAQVPEEAADKSKQAPPQVSTVNC